MNTTDENTPDENTPEESTRPFGFWLKAVDRLMAAEFAAAFEGEEIGRRDWRLLNIVDGTVPARRPLNGHKLHRLVERGWVAPEGDGWTLTDAGRDAKDRLGTIVDGIRSKVAGSVSDDDMATTLASLEKIARAFGWDEETPLPGRRRHGFGRRGGFGGRGRGFGHGPFGPRHGFGHVFGHDAELDPDADCDRRGYGHGHGRSDDHQLHPGHSRHGQPGHDPRAHEGRGHGPHRAARFAQHAYERGFDAGFTRGRDA